MNERAIVPKTAKDVEKAKPGVDLSIRYHKTGLASAKVDDNCNVDDQGTLLCTKCQSAQTEVCSQVAVDLPQRMQCPRKPQHS
jgi:hypothetical protein